MPDLSTQQFAEVERIAYRLLLEAIRERYDYDFSHYRQASFKRRLRRFLDTENLSSTAELIPRLLLEPRFFQLFLQTISISVTEMFRDPLSFAALREKVFPHLATYPSLKIWHAGCASGEEVYALAIFLVEAGLYERSRIYATDINDKVLAMARDGIYPVDKIRQFSLSYQQAGGQGSLSDYFHASHKSAIFRAELKKNIVFASHNLAADASFGAMHLIVCRNVLIYYDKILQRRILQLFLDSLVERGFLWLGTKENISYAPAECGLVEFIKTEKIYRWQ